MDISVVIPAYNEERRLPQTLDKIIDYFQKKSVNFEIIVVTDGSKDNTPQKIKENLNFNKTIKLIENNKNYGKGYSVRQGVLKADGDYILMSDADLSTPIEDVEKLKTYLENGYDIAIGSRGLPESNVVVYQKWWREDMGKIFNLFVRFLVLKDFKDTQCGFKLFKKDIAKKIFSLQKINGFAFDVEILYIADKLGSKIKEVPITWYNSEESKVNAISDSLKMLKDLFLIKWLSRGIKR